MAVHGFEPCPSHPLSPLFQRSTLIIEVLALNKNTGFIHPGQKVELKLDTFPFQKYGTIDAELFYVSPDAQEDQKIGLVYKVKLKPKRLTIRIKDKDIPLAPGMSVTAEIKTGREVNMWMNH